MVTSYWSVVLACLGISRSWTTTWTPWSTTSENVSWRILKINITLSMIVTHLICVKLRYWHVKSKYTTCINYVVFPSHWKDNCLRYTYTVVRCTMYISSIELASIHDMYGRYLDTGYVIANCLVDVFIFKYTHICMQ